MAETIRKLRLAYNETQEQFARRLNVSVVTIARYETNSRPRNAILKRLEDLARERHLENYSQIFAGDERGVFQLKEKELKAAVRVLELNIECLPPGRFREVRAAIALVNYPAGNIDGIEELLGSALVRADDEIQSLVTRLDLEEGRRRHEQLGNIESLATAATKSPRASIGSRKPKEH